MQAQQQVPAHSKILPTQIWRVDGIKKTLPLILSLQSSLSWASFSQDRLKLFVLTCTPNPNDLH